MSEKKSKKYRSGLYWWRRNGSQKWEKMNCTDVKISEFATHTAWGPDAQDWATENGYWGPSIPSPEGISPDA